MRRIVQAIFSLLLLGGVQAAQAQLFYHVEMDTTALIDRAEGPFALDFQLIDGDDMIDNTLTLSNFDFGGGAAAGDPILVGGASGTVGQGITLSDSAFFTAFTQTFTPGQTLKFDVSMLPDYAGGFPDQFSMAILQGDGGEIPTESPSGALITVDLVKPTPQIATFAGTGDFSGLGRPMVTSVPGPSALTVTLLSVVPGVGLAFRHRKRRQENGMA